MFLPAVQHILYLMLQAKKEEEPAEPTTKICPYCQSEISIKASRCLHCTSVLEETKHLAGQCRVNSYENRSDIM